MFTCLRMAAASKSTSWVDFSFKIIIIGDYRVGKTSLLCKYTGREYREPSSTISVDFRVKTLQRNERRIKLQIWDIAGQERFRTAVASYYRGALGVVLVYDITNRESFHNIGYWHEDMRKSCEPHAKGILIGNRCHLSHLRQVQPEEGKNLAEHLGMPFYETSTEKNININECFDELVDSLLEEIERGRQLKELNTLMLPASGEEDRAVDACSCKLL